jgi:hypothetical protein
LFSFYAMKYYMIVSTLILCTTIAALRFWPSQQAQQLESRSIKLPEPMKDCGPKLVRSKQGVWAAECDFGVVCLGRLCIGTEHAASNQEGLRSAGVTHVVSAVHQCYKQSLPCLDLDMLDTSGETRIVRHLIDTTSWIDQALRETSDGRVFVHCAAGVSRSSTIVLAYMLTEDRNKEYETALAELRVVRSVVQPNALFELVLRLLSHGCNWNEIKCAVQYQRDFAVDPAHSHRCSDRTHVILDKWLERNVARLFGL